ncbi:MAG: 30S ribosomal protein S12 methylthiotransferase RimO [Desulfobacterales bacterium]|nr:30S ribosomal protein S12 methylthiotransferase RimO [Desulfobacterales bacterium]
MKVHLVSLGCARNRVDSEHMLGSLQAAGLQITEDPSEAEIIVVNTCSFITPAVEESIETILEMAEHKKSGRCRKLIVAGCLPERYRRELIRSLPEVDAFLGTGAFDRIAEASTADSASPICMLPDPETPPLSPPHAPRVRSTRYTAYLKIAEGCRRRCTYCIIPKLRGRQRSRSLDDILAEAREQIDSGVKELTLIAQESTAYGADLKPPINLATLLARLADLAGQTPEDRRPWIRFLYGHPESLSDDTIQVVAERPEICSYFDIPIQHASPSVLRAMGRRYGPEEIQKMAAKIRSAAPEAALRTTAIVGFPGETEADFSMLLELASEIRFDHLGVFLYSDADDLPSHRLGNFVDEDLARERFHQLMAMQAEISRDHNLKHIGLSLPVLVEERIDEQLFAGRTATQAPEVDGATYVRSLSLSPGSFVRTRIVEADEYDLIGVPE